MKETKGILILLCGSLIWGIAFVAQSSAADLVEPFTFNGVRFVLAALTLYIVIILRKALGNEPAVQHTGTKSNALLAGVVCGIFLFIASNLQQLGIAIYPDGVAVAGRSGFITATYVVMVAVVGFFIHKKIEPSVLVAVIGCMVGLYLLCLSDGIDQIYTGDTVVFACAIAFMFQILAIDHYDQVDGIKMAAVEFSVCAILSLIAMVIFETPNWNNITAAWLPILYSGILSGGVAYTLQILGQKYARPAVASIAMSFESVFAALAGWAILGETITGKELLGCIFVFAAIIVAQLPAFFAKSSQ